MCLRIVRCLFLFGGVFLFVLWRVCLFLRGVFAMFVCFACVIFVAWFFCVVLCLFFCIRQRLAADAQNSSIREYDVPLFFAC